MKVAEISVVRANFLPRRIDLPKAALIAPLFQTNFRFVEKTTCNHPTANERNSDIRLTFDKRTFAPLLTACAQNTPTVRRASVAAKRHLLIRVAGDRDGEVAQTKDCLKRYIYRQYKKRPRKFGSAFFLIVLQADCLSNGRYRLRNYRRRNRIFLTDVFAKVCFRLVLRR